MEKNKKINNQRKEASEWNIDGEPFSENQLRKILSYPKFDPKGCWKKHFAKPKPVSVDEFEINDDTLDFFYKDCRVDSISIQDIVCWFLTHSPYFKVK